MKQQKSEVARLLREIETTYEAARRGLSSYAVVSRHDFISARMEQIDQYHASLQQLVGEREALELLARTIGAK